MRLPRAINLLRPEPEFKRECFTEGLRAAGYEVVDSIAKPEPDDVCVIWGGQRGLFTQARQFRNVLVSENSYIRLRHWYSLSRDHHNGLGSFPVGGPERWASFGIELQPWRNGKEVVILGQRSIGEPCIASPKGWESQIQRKVGGRIRPHPGRNKDGLPLDRDLAHARCAVTWGSAAGIQALIMGVPVFYAQPKWIGASACRHVTDFAKGPLCDDEARLKMFQRLAWAMSPAGEIRSGESICRLIGR